MICVQGLSTYLFVHLLFFLDAFVYLTTMVTTTPVENKPQNSKIESKPVMLY